jgi:hypothetical protein
MRKPSTTAAIFLVGLILLIVVFIGIACSNIGDDEAPGPSTAAAEVTPANTVATLVDAKSSGTEAGEANQPSADDSTPTVSAPSPTPTEASSPTVEARLLANLNLRQGPGTGYAIVGKLPAESDVTVVGQNEDGSWLVIETETGTAWIAGEPDLVEIDRTSLAALAVVAAPPLAYDVNNANVKRILNEIPLVVHHEERITCASHGGVNNLLAEVANGNVIGPHSGDFVMGHDNVLFEYSNGSLQLIRENPVARFENGEKYLPFEKAIQMFATGEIVWNGSIGDWPARGVTGCDSSAAPK